MSGREPQRLSITGAPYVEFTSEGPNALTLQEGRIVPETSGFFENRITPLAAISFLTSTISSNQQGSIDVYSGWKGVIRSIQKQFDRINSLAGADADMMRKFAKHSGVKYPLSKVYYTVVPRVAVFGRDDKDYCPYHILLYVSRVPQRDASIVSGQLRLFYTNDFGRSQSELLVPFSQFVYSGVFDTSPGRIWGKLTGTNALHMNACTKLQFNSKCPATFVNMELPHFRHCSDTALENFEEVTGGCRKWIAGLTTEQTDFITTNFCGSYGPYQIDECLCHARKYDPYYQILSVAGSGQFVKDACWWYPCGHYDEFKYWRASDTDIPSDCGKVSCFNSRRIKEVAGSTIGSLDETSFMLVTCVTDENTDGGGEEEEGGSGSGGGGGVDLETDIPEWLHTFLPSDAVREKRKKQEAEKARWKGIYTQVLIGAVALLVLIFGYGIYTLYFSHKHTSPAPTSSPIG